MYKRVGFYSNDNVSSGKQVSNTKYLTPLRKRKHKRVRTSSLSTPNQRKTLTDTPFIDQKQSPVKHETRKSQIDIDLTDETNKPNSSINNTCPPITAALDFVIAGSGSNIVNEQEDLKKRHVIIIADQQGRYLQSHLQKLLGSNYSCYVDGDFNIDMLKADKYSFEFKQLLQGFNLKLAINDPTRLCSGTCIDNFGHNMKDCKTRILELALSDHTAQLLMCPVSEKFGNPYWFIMKRDYSKENIEKFKHCLMAIHFKDVYNTNNPNTAFNSFFDEFKLFYDMCFPLMRIRMRSYQRPKWITKGIIKCSRQKRKLLWKYRKDPNLLNKKCFKTYSSRLKNIMKLTKKAQNNYFIKTSKNKTKATWTIINEYKNKTKNYITQINNDHKKITDPNRIAELFNNFFIEQVKPHDNFKARSMTSNNVSSLFIRPTNPDEILTIIRSLKDTNSTGYDDISTKIVKEVATQIAPILSYIINLCIENGIFPDKLKISIIKPLYKKADRECMSSYRPVALIPIFSKIIEKVIYKALYNFLEKYNLLVEEQVGFRKNKNINLA
ncbi:uncharacterized protein LOC128200995 [Galleria mellonella]|uniref:Uncharacterized protein LOC128200995 n=1 Tax=Galleria mellonella TaxID=7137 RepID=A0ABM3MMA8_GALME|nr:uncharacterized protein LOC128200995 [Galleria mellonella]